MESGKAWLAFLICTVIDFAIYRIYLSFIFPHLDPRFANCWIEVTKPRVTLDFQICEFFPVDAFWLIIAPVLAILVLTYFLHMGLMKILDGKKNVKKK
jgi:hypothetical protein